MWNSSGENGILQGITVCLVSAVLSTMWWPGRFQTVSRGHILVFFNRHCSTMNLVKEKQGGLVPPGLKRWPFKLIKHFADTTSDSFTILGLWVLGLAVSHINESQLQTYESRTLFLMTSLQYYCILGLAEIKTLHPRDKIMCKKYRMRR